MNKLHPLHKLDGHFNTISGKKFSLFNPRPDMIDIEDIARALAYQPHFGGHTPKFFSVAQHCLLTVDLLPDKLVNYNPIIALMALLHDAAEAYVGDMIKPLKVYFSEFEDIENEIMKVVCQKFGLDFAMMHTVKKYDLLAQEIEYATFYKKSNRLNYMQPDVARVAFLKKFYDINDLL